MNGHVMCVDGGGGGGSRVCCINVLNGGILRLLTS